MKIWIFTLSFWSAVLALNAQTAANVRGQVYDTSGEPLVGAHVRMTPGAYLTGTGEHGDFEFSDVPAGTYQLTVSYVGYETKTLDLEVSGDKTLRIEMKEAGVLTDEIVVRGLRADVNSGTTFENIDKEKIEKNILGQELPFLLQMTPSVVVTSDAGQGVGHTNMRIRGSDATRINTTINGIPYNDAESQGTFWLNMPDFASSVESIQIQRGVGTSTNGGGAFGASLNINTNTLNPEPYIELNNTAGSFGTIRNTVKLGTGLLDNRFVLDARLSRIKSDGYIDRAFSDLKSLYLSGGWYSDDKILRFNIISGKQSAYQAWNGVPEELLHTNRTYNEFTYPDQTDNYTQTHYQLHWSQQFTSDWDWSLSLNYTPGAGFYEEYKEDQAFADYGLQPIELGDTLISNTDLVRQLWLDNQFYGFTSHTRWKATDHLSLTLGGAFFQYSGDHFGKLKWARYASDSFADDTFYFNDAMKNDGNIYLKTTWKVRNSSLFLDLQSRFVSYDIQGTHRDGRTITQDDRMTFFNPKIGYTHHLDAQTQIYASVAKGSREPNRDDYKESTPETRPRPEKLYDFEAGFRKASSRHHFSGNLYYMYYRDQLILTGQINDVGNPVRTNVKDSYRLGLELSDTYAISSRWNIGGNLALSRNIIPDYTEYVDQYDDEFRFVGQEKTEYKQTEIAFSPALIGGLNTVFSPTPAWTFSWETRYVSRQYMDNTATKNRSIDPYSYSNFRFSYERPLLGAENVTLALDLRNIFGAAYESSGYTFGYYQGGVRQDFNYYYPQAGFHFLATVNVRF